MLSDLTTLIKTSKPISKEDYAYLTLRESILAGKLKEGETLAQASISEELGISSIPVRAAITRLISDGLVEQEPHYPPRVTTLSSEGLEELLVIRMHLETLAIQHAIPNIGQQEILELEELVEAMDQTLIDNNMPAFGSLNKQFHLQIYQANPYPLLNQIIKDLWDNSDRSRSRMVFGLVPGLAAASQVDHHHLVDMIKSGDVESATKLIIDHKKRFREQIPKDIVGK